MSIEYLCIESWHPKDDKKGWIPRNIFERITGQKFVKGHCHFIHVDHCDKIHKHRKFVNDFVFNQQERR